MRLIISSCGFMVTLSLIILIHSTIIGNNIRKSEVSNSLDIAMDYAFDMICETYADEDYSRYKEEQKNEICKNIMNKFCIYLSEMIISDGEVKVYLVEADLNLGLFHIKVVEEYNYPFKIKKGKCYYEKTYTLI